MGLGASCQVWTLLACSTPYQTSEGSRMLAKCFLVAPTVLSAGIKDMYLHSSPKNYSYTGVNSPFLCCLSICG